MLVVSVLVIAMWASAQLFVPAWRSGLGAATGDIQKMVNDGHVNGG